MKSLSKVFFFAFLSFYPPITVVSQNPPRPKYILSDASAEVLVARVLKLSPIVDGHNDLLVRYYDCKDCPRDLKEYPIDVAAKGHTDIPRWRKGGVGGQLLNVFGPEVTPESYLDGVDLVYRMEAAYPKDLKIVQTSAEMRNAMRQGKIAILPITESSVRINNNMALLRTYYKLGLRSLTFAYKTNDLADGSDDQPKHNGVSAFGREMVNEMNRLGIIIDISHVSAQAMHGVLDTTKAPVIFSHSNVRALCDVNRNVPDDVLRKLKANNGIVMLTFVPYFATNEFSAWYTGGERYWDELDKKYSGNRAKIIVDFKVWENSNPEPIVTVADMADHFDYVRRLIGIDHIGIAGDFDGIDYFVKSLEDVSSYPKLLVELAKRGWTEKELRKVTGENFLRVFEEVETKSAELRKIIPPSLVKFPLKR